MFWFITGAEIKTGTEEATFTSINYQILKIIDRSAETFIFSVLVFNWLPLQSFFCCNIITVSFLEGTI